jgi:hypothetical protein
VSDEWWTAFVARANEIGAKIPQAPVLPPVPGATPPSRGSLSQVQRGRRTTDIATDTVVLVY